MSKSKLTLLIDGNWLLISRISVLNKRYVDDYTLCQDLKIMIIKSINIVLRTFPLVDNIIFCADGGSWRSQLEIPKCLHHDIEGENVEYKGTRVRSTDINWDLLFSTYDDFLEVLKQSGLNVCKEKNIEGDDWVWYWSNYLNSQGTNCIIWTKDNDLKQLIKTDANKCFTVWWNKDAGTFTDNLLEEDDFNFMFNYEFSQNEKLLNHVFDKSIKTTKINPKSIIIDKILKGDVSDNILPVILRNSKNKNVEKKFKISSKDINYDLDYHNKDEVRKYIHNIINSKNYIGRIDENKTEEDIFEHFCYNMRLVALEKDNYPPEILEIFENYKDYNLSKDTSNAESQIQATSNKLNGILDII